MRPIFFDASPRHDVLQTCHRGVCSTFFTLCAGCTVGWSWRMGSRFCSSPTRRQTRRPQPWTSTQVSPAASPAAPPPIIILFSTRRGQRGFYKELFFSVVDPDPATNFQSSGSGSNLYYLSIFRNYYKKHLKFNKKKCCGVHPFWFVLAWRLVCKEYSKIFKRIMSLQKYKSPFFSSLALP